jgi:hypothetical protein
MRMNSVKDIQIRLFRLASSIRNHATRSALGQRNIFNTIDAEHREVIVHRLVAMESRRITDFVHQVRRELGNDSDPGDPASEFYLQDQVLIQRLGRANVRRRHQYIHWRKRQKRSEANADPGPRPTNARSRHAPPAPEPDFTKQGQHVTQISSLMTQSMPSSVTKAQSCQIGPADHKSVKSNVTRTPSARGPSGEKVGWPEVPSGLPPGAYFTCPYCFNLCPERYRSQQGWK